MTKSVLFIRCMKHRDVPQLNSNEHSGGECGACVRDEELLEERRQERAEDIIVAANKLINCIDSEPDGPILKADGQPPWKELEGLIWALEGPPSPNEWNPGNG